MTLTAPPARASEQPRWRRMVPPVAVAGGLAAATLALYLRDPHDRGSWGMCPTAAMGFSCPGCGGLRAVNDLGNLELGAAASSNLLFVLSLPFIAWVFLRWTRGRWTGRRWEPSDRSLAVAGITVGVLMVVFTVVRNLPAGAWLAP
ncbi:DUF2752 domain-containing protein [Nocardioides sp. J54]|uniref:DUF2752 domain-containing protein n=1 Tax=Nocardioides sp. J54 TaxID=935866 RepID=UPI00048A868D|nr:DUF2752 domain-containing protein [Nocardioides sp. J54]